MLQVPFSAEEFFGVFAAYNEAVWPAQLLLTVAAIGTIILAFRRSRKAHRWSLAVFAFGMHQDAGLLASALVTFGLLVLERKRTSAVSPRTARSS